MALSGRSADSPHDDGMSTTTTPTAKVVRYFLTGLAVAVGVGLIVWMPHLIGMSWPAIGAALGGISLATLVSLAVLWMAGLLVHTIVLTAALPGLTWPRALLLNLSGSAASNVLPFGGAAGMGWGFLMARTWKVPATSFAAFTVISNAWNVIGKLLVGASLVSAALLLGAHVPTSVHVVLLLCAAITLLLVVVGVAFLRTPTAAATLGRGIDATVNSSLRLVRSHRQIACEEWIVQTRGETAETINAGWARLTLGVLAYMTLQAILLGACLFAVGAHVSLLALLAAFGTERLLTLIPLTPGGSGFTELGAVAILVALGGAPVPVAAGVLLYRFYSHFMEIPVGGASGLLWMRAHRRGIRKAALT